jgi:D-aspartate ligase
MVETRGPTRGGRPTAVVTGASHPTALGSARALQRAGARVIGLVRPGASPSLRSRRWAALHTVEGDWIAALEALAATLDGPAFLLPTQDQVVAAMSTCRDDLLEAYRFVLPPDDIVQTFLDKTRFYDWARPLGLPLPDSRIVRSRAELREALGAMRPPLILKPLFRTSAWHRASPVHKAIRLDAARDLDQVDIDLFAVAPAYILSQWIEGPDDSVHYCLAYCSEPGVIDAWYTGRKLLQYPRLTGSTAICVGTSNGEVRELTEETFRHAGFRGLGSLEVKYGPDGRPYITEPTVGRPNLQSYSAVAAGCNLHAIAMADALGLDRPAGAGRSRNGLWVEEDALVHLATGRSGEPVPWRLLAREARRVRRFRGAYWSWRDPGPTLGLLAGKAGRFMRRLFRRG